MSTTQGDIAKPHAPLGEKDTTTSTGMQDYAEAIKKINKERTDRYFDLIAPAKSDKKERDGIVRRTKP